MIINIPSKGRSQNQTTSKLLDNVGLQHTIWVEPQDEQAYRSNLLPTATLHVLDKDNQGIAYVRQQILNKGRDTRQPYWIIDDDITQIVKLASNGSYMRRDKVTPVDVVLQEMEESFKINKIDYGAPGHLSTVGYHGGKLNYNKQSYCVVWIDPVTFPNNVDYDRNCLHVEDVVFVLTGIFNGAKCLHHEGFAYSAPNPGTTAGGLGIYTKNMSQWNKQNEIVIDFLESWRINAGGQDSLYKMLEKPDKQVIYLHWSKIHKLARVLNPSIYWSNINRKPRVYKEKKLK